MQNKENFEEFIKKEINQIKLEGADTMWSEFQGKLPVDEPKRTKGFWARYSILLLLLIVAVGSFYLGTIFNQSRTTVDPIQYTENQEQLTKQPSKQQTAPLSALETTKDELSESNSDRNSEAKHPTRENAANCDAIPNKLEGYNEEQMANSGNQQMNGSPSQKTNTSTTARSEEHVNSEALARAANSSAENVENTNSTATNNAKEENFMNSDAKETTANAVGKELNQTAGRQPNFTGLAVKSPSQLSAKELVFEHSPHPDSDGPRAKLSYLRFESNFAPNRMQQYALGYGRDIPLVYKLSMHMQVGASLDLGYSFSQDSIFITNGMSILEQRKDKDLKNLWNTYLDLGLNYRVNRLRFNLGLRGSYAVLNRFTFSETTRTTHLGSFFSSEEITTRDEGSGGWTGINRMSLDAYLSVNYRINTNYSFGVFAGKRLNALINQNMASKAYSNRPFRFGVVLNTHF